MTNEKAIEVLEADKAYLYPDECHNSKAYDLAIKTLRREVLAEKITMRRLIDAELLKSKISLAGFPHIDRNGRIDKSYVYELINSCQTKEENKGGNTNV